MSASAEIEREHSEPDEGPSHRLRRDVVIIGFLGAAFGAARVLTEVPLAIGALACVIGLLAVRPRVVMIGVFLLIGARSGHELGHLQPAQSRPVDEVTIELVADPRAYESVWRAQVELDGERLWLDARTSAAASLQSAASGDRLVVSGSVRGQRPTSSWATSRRIVGRLTIDRVSGRHDAGGVVGVANVVRSTLRQGARSLPRDRRVLFTGLVFGDDRGQDPIVADNFRAAGLGHLLAVSGQNVVFVLLLAAPVLGRIRSIPTRVLLSLAVLASFGFLTRFEPSVTRALVMAGFALIAHAVGRPADAATVLLPAVVGLLLFDPLLAWSLAFQLSVAATVGLVVLTPRIADLLPGPSALRFSVAATVGAQVAVSPLLLAAFGRISLVAVPANVFAAPAAAGVMVWGIVAGGVAGLAPDLPAATIHLPTRLMLWWIDSVAATFARIPVGTFGPLHLIVVVSCGVVLAALGRAGGDGMSLGRRVTAALLMIAVLLPLLSPRELDAGVHTFAAGVTVARSAGGHDVVILEAPVRSADALETLRSARLGRIDLLISTDGSRRAGRTVRLLSDRFDITDVWAPPDHEVPGARAMDTFRGVVGTLFVDSDESGAVFVVPLIEATR